MPFIDSIFIKAVRIRKFLAACAEFSATVSSQVSQGGKIRPAFL